MDALALLKNPLADMAEMADDVASAYHSTTTGAPKTNPNASTSQPAAKARATAGKFKVSEKGTFLVTSNVDDDQPDKFEFVCGEINVVAQIRDQHSGQWGKLLQWQDPDGLFHEWAMPMSALQGDGAEVRRELAAGGLEIAQSLKLRNALVRYLSEAKTSVRARGVQNTGWLLILTQI